MAEAHFTVVAGFFWELTVVAFRKAFPTTLHAL
jgi:hypothetical protein